MIDFEVPPDAKEVRELARKFVDEFCIPAEAQLSHRPEGEIVAELQEKARAQGLWCPFMPPEWGGMGLGPLANAMVTVEIARSMLGPDAVNSRGPDDATILTILAYGTQEQKEKYLRPLVDGKARICFAMTERAAGADATGMQTRAVRDGDNWVLNGEKWFASGAERARFAVVMAKTDPDAPRHRQFSTFLVDIPSPGWNFIRSVPTLGNVGRGQEYMGHGEIQINDLVLPAGNMLGAQGEGFETGQHRLGFGRLRHGMHNVAIAQRALDMATERVINRSTFGAPLAERQGIQWMLADCARDLYISRLMLLHVAYLMETGKSLRQENAIVKVFLANMVHRVVDTAMQIHGALGYSHDTPLAEWYAHIRMQRIVDGPDEVHRTFTGRNLIKAYQRHGTTASACGGDLV
jgi:acyl-CoA dehydrogenase